MNNATINRQNPNYLYAFTVFTPTYNRAHTLHRVYDSLKAQTFHDFEWLIVDDGSTDNTENLIKEWKMEVSFPIRYIYKENGGKHTAFNVGVKEAQGELFLTFDSDDACVPEALERFKYHWDSIPSDQKEKFSGVTCLCQDEKGQIIGDKFPMNVIDSDSLEMRYRYKMRWDNWGFHRTDVLKKYPFPEPFQKLSHTPESIVWEKIARRYKTRYVNEPLSRVFYTVGNSLSRGNNPRNYAVGGILHYHFALNNNIGWLLFAPVAFIISGAQYVRFSFHEKISLLKQWHNLNNCKAKVLWVFTLPIGLLFYLIIDRMFKNRNEHSWKN